MQFTMFNRLIVNRSFLVVSCYLMALFISILSAHKVYATEQQSAPTQLLPSQLSAKYYRQALYFYFQNKPDEALRQLNINQDYFLKTPVHESLFTAGLQISQGLHQDAQALLEKLSAITDPEQTAYKNNLMSSSAHNTIDNNLQKEALKVIVFLQLAEQKIAEKNFAEAETVLANITALPKHFLAQYYVMQQSIAWPQKPDTDKFMLNEVSKAQLEALISESDNGLGVLDNATAYILLNAALREMNQQSYSLAEKKLKRLQVFTWQEKTGSFWQKLFANTISSNQTVTELKQLEQNGINHYAQLLLARLYIEQGYFQQGYQQLENFPKDTPFTEQALFLFGYSAFKLQQYNVTEIVLNTLITQYPYAHFTQQAWALSAQQYTVQNKLNKALNRYLEIEEYYQTKQHELSEFSNTITAQKNLLAFYRSVNESNISVEVNNNKEMINNNKNNSINGLWLTLLLRQTDIATLYQQLQSVEEIAKQLQAQHNKSQWLATAIELNVARQNTIRNKQKNTNYQQLLTNLAEKKNQLAVLLDNAETLADGELFADKTQKKLLTRIENSKTALAFIKEHPHNSRSTVDYQQRLSRVQGVLAWQLQQEFPARYWQTRQSLNVLERSYDNTLQKYKEVEELLAQSSTLPTVSDEQGLIANKITSLLSTTEQLKTRVNSKLKTRISLFVENEQMKINEFLLFNQRAMASVIEKLNQQEAL
jgi:exonuclease SbcC